MEPKRFMNILQNADLADNGNWSVGGGISTGLDAGFNASIQHSVVIPF